MAHINPDIFSKIPDIPATVTLRDFNPGKNPVVDEIKRLTDELAEFIIDAVPENSCRAIALTNYQQAAMWAVRANFDDGDIHMAMTFGGALATMRSGNKLYRRGWNGSGMWIARQEPDEHSKMSQPYIYMKTVTDDLVPWLASQTDLLAEDWFIFRD